MDRLDRFSDSGVDCLDITWRIGEHFFIIRGFRLERLAIDVILLFQTGIKAAEFVTLKDLRVDKSRPKKDLSMEAKQDFCGLLGKRFWQRQRVSLLIGITVEEALRRRS